MDRWISLKQASGATIKNIKRDSTIFQFGISKCLLYGKGTSFVNVHMRALLNGYKVDHVKVLMILKEMVKQ